MEIQTNTDHSVEKTTALTNHVESVVHEALDRFSQHTTRIVVHLSEGKDSKNPNGDHRCMMEAHIKNHAPIVATDHAHNLHQAIQHTAEKLKRVLDSTFGRLNIGTKGGNRIADVLVDTSSSDDA